MEYACRMAGEGSMGRQGGMAKKGLCDFFVILKFC
jgi:hypothetical protein